MDFYHTPLKISLEKLLSYTNQGNTLNENVSNANVGWHIDHCLLVINRVLSNLEQSDEKEFVSSFNKNRFIVFLTGRIPLGKAKAPEAVKPTEAFALEQTTFYGDKALQKIENAANWHANKNFHHHIFGALNKKQTLKFLDIHTKHHLKIVKGIVGN